MKLWPLLSLLLLMQQPSAGAAGDKGAAALAAGLWEVAEGHFREALADSELAPDARSALAIRLCEALTRGGKQAEALQLLEDPALIDHLEAPFWKGQALAAQGRFADAVEVLATLAEAAPQRTEAGFTRASLLLALEKPDEALAALAQLPAGPADARAMLYRAEILLDLGRADEAREILPAAKSVATGDRPRAAFLEAQLLLAADRPAEAEAAFRALVDQPQGQSLARYHHAAIGLADALAAQGNPAGARLSLLAFIGDHPDSPLLVSMFQRVIRWLPEDLLPDDATLEIIGQWITPANLPRLGPVVLSEGAAGAWPPREGPPNERLVFSLYTRALGLHRVATLETRDEARRMMHRLRVEAPGHPLSNRALYQMARWQLEAGDREQAIFILETLRTGTTATGLQGEAAFLEARIAFMNGEPKQAAELFDEAAKFLADADARTARLQAAIARLQMGAEVIFADDEAAGSLAADLELERALSTTAPAAARTAIDEFLIRFPAHPRAIEARLAAAEAALASPVPDLSFASAQLDTVLTAAAETEELPTPRIALARLRIADLANDSEAALVLAQSLVEAHPDAPEAAEAALTLGRHLFQAGDYNAARLVLEKLAASDTDPARAQVAWLLAARAAALGGTPQSKDEALVLFNKAGAAEGPVTAIVTLEKARHLIDLYRLAEASEFLREAIAGLAENDPLRLPAGILLGEALYAQGSSNPQSLVEALVVYDGLLVHAETHPALRNRLQYLRGTTLEQLPDETNPAKKRENQAFQAYYAVLETDAPPLEWKYFELCGFRALALLEKAERWQSAIAVAKKIASFKGPRAGEAATRADQLRITNHIWED